MAERLAQLCEISNLSVYLVRTGMKLGARQIRLTVGTEYSPDVVQREPG